MEGKRLRDIVGCTPSDTDKTLPRISFLFIFVLCLVRISS